MSKHLSRGSKRWATMKPTKRQATIQRLIRRNHAGRIPTDLLKGSPQARQVRQRRVRRQELNSPVAEGVPTTHRQVNRQARQQAIVKYRPQIRQVRQEKKSARRLQHKIPSYYKAYQDAVRQAENETTQANALANQQIQGLQGSVVQSNAAGAPLSAANAQAAAQAAEVRKRMLASVGAGLASKGASQSAYLADQGRIGAARKLQDILAQRNARAGLQAKLESLKAQRGSYEGSQRQALIQQARQTGIAAEGLHLNEKKAKASARASRRNAALSAARINETHRSNVAGERLRRQSNATTRQHDRVEESLGARRLLLDQRKLRKSGGNHGSNFLSTSEQNTANNLIDEAAEWFRRYKGHVPGHQIRQRLLTGANEKDENGAPVNFPRIPKIYVNAAEDLIYRGGLSPANVKALHRAGIRTKHRRKLKPKAALKTVGSVIGDLLG